MTSPASTNVVSTVTDTNGNSAEFSLQADGECGLSLTLASGDTSGFALIPNGAVEIAAAIASGAVALDVIADAVSSSTLFLNATNATGALSNVTVGPHSLFALTNGGHSAETSVENDIGYINTLNPQGLPNSNYTRGSLNRVAHFSGIGQLTDAQAGAGAVNCNIPFPIPPGATNSMCRIDAEIMVKCVVQSNLPGQVSFVGDYFMQHVYTLFTNDSGTIAVANGNTGTPTIDGFTGVAIADTQGTTFTISTLPSKLGYKLLCDVTVAPGAGGLQLQVVQAQNTTPAPPIPFYANIGVCIVEIYATVYYN
jgi:hypothetical protein